MFGSNYANHPELLLQSLQEMNALYRNKSSFNPNSILAKLQSFYVRIFGIPEIGFQVRSMYFRKALRSLNNFVPQRILDIGCGIGVHVFYLAKLFPRARVDGWDIDKQKIVSNLKLKKKFSAYNANFTYGDITKKPTQNSLYDFIVIIDVLEHIKDYQGALKNIYSLLKPEGYLYIHAPQINQKRFFAQFRSWEHRSHVREGFKPEDFKRELKQVGYKINLMDHSFGYFGSLAWEINHKLLLSSQILAGLIYPFLYLLSLLDLYVKNNCGLGIAILAQKKFLI